MRFLISLLVMLSLLASSCSKIEDPILNAPMPSTIDADIPQKNAISFSPNRNLLWGDLHVHTSLSYDAYTFGARTLPDDAYTYMKGGTIRHALGYPVRARKPLDFGAVTDHAEFLGVPRHAAGQPEGELDPLVDVLKNGSKAGFAARFAHRMMTQMGDDETREKHFAKYDIRAVSMDAWQQIIDAAERHNSPGVFTTFIGYEWTSHANETNLHRNVIYRSSKVPPFPFSSRNSLNPEDLWRAMDEQRRRGMDALAIPHNSNASDGKMFDTVTYDGSPQDQLYAGVRAINEPLVEIFQIKGSSEAHPGLSPDDEFAGFEIMDRLLAFKSAPSEPAGSYVRDAIGRGLKMQAEQSFNPYQFGFIGSSDSHNSTSAPEEDNYTGKVPLGDGVPSLRLGTAHIDEDMAQTSYGASGLVAVWAEENSRESIFAAMRRRETYATSGSRIALRFFAGPEYGEDMLQREDWLSMAYRLGVPMGGTLLGDEVSGRLTANTGMKFIVAAQKETDGANLDRLQIVKLWVSRDGERNEQIFDVAASGDRLSDSGKVATLASTVDAKNASYENSIGATQLAVVWEDPGFDASQHAAYYARAIEIPVPRYTTHDAKRLGIEPPSPTEIQERAVSSPIWYLPPGKN